MAAHRILIVDEQIETRKWLRGTLDSLGLDLQVVAVPSGEEALLELRTARFDLLLTDVNLPGIDGFELLKKVKKQSQGLKVALILRKNETRPGRDPHGTDADAYLHKPLDSADFLDTVERCLGVAGTVAPSPVLQVGEDAGKLLENIAERLTRLRQTLGATTCLVLDNTGAILACAGGLPDEDFSGLLMQPVIDSFWAGMKVSRVLQSALPFSLQFFSGQSNDLVLAQVGDQHALMVILKPLNLPHELSDLTYTISEGVEDLRQILMILGIDQEQVDEPVEEQDDSEVFIDEAELQAEVPRIEALFQEESSKTLKAEELDAFWRTAAEAETADEARKANRLTYEQALQLGIAPEENKEMQG